MGMSDDTKTDDDRPATETTTFPIPASQRVKREGMEFYEKTLGAPKYVVSMEKNAWFFYEKVLLLL